MYTFKTFWVLMESGQNALVLESDADKTSGDKIARIQKGTLKIPAAYCPQFLSLLLKAAKKEIPFLGSFVAR